MPVLPSKTNSFWLVQARSCAKMRISVPTYQQLDINSLSRYISPMQRTQIQLPDHLFEASRALASRKEISLAELVRRGLEYLIATSPEGSATCGDWELPAPHDLQATDPFNDVNWRANIHGDRLRVAGSSTAYKTKQKS